MQEDRGHRGARPAPEQGAVGRGRSRRLRADLLRRAAQRCGARIAPGHRGRRFPDPQDAGARGEAGAPVARRDGHHAAVAGQRRGAVSRRPVHRVHPARRRAAQLQHGQRAAHPDAAGARRHHQRAHGGTAHPPHAGRQVHRPRVRHHEGEGHPARRRPLRQLLPARGLRQAHHPAGLGHRLCADQGGHRAHAVPGHHAPRHAVLGRPAARRPVPGRLGARPAGRDAEPALCAGGLGRPARGRLERPHRLRAPGGAAGFRRTFPATRSTPAARPSWSTRPARISRRWPDCPRTSFLQIPSPAKRTNTHETQKPPPLYAGPRGRAGLDGRPPRPRPRPSRSASSCPTPPAAPSM